MQLGRADSSIKGGENAIAKKLIRCNQRSITDSACQGTARPDGSEL